MFPDATDRCDSMLLSCADCGFNARLKLAAVWAALRERARRVLSKVGRDPSGADPGRGRDREDLP